MVIHCHQAILLYLEQRVGAINKTSPFQVIHRHQIQFASTNGSYSHLVASLTLQNGYYSFCDFTAVV